MYSHPTERLVPKPKEECPVGESVWRREDNGQDNVEGVSQNFNLSVELSEPGTFQFFLS